MNPYCCDALKQALTEEYLYEPLGYKEKVTENGQQFVDLVVLPPVIEKHRKPSLMLAYCPFCGTKFKETP